MIRIVHAFGLFSLVSFDRQNKIYKEITENKLSELFLLALLFCLAFFDRKCCSALNPLGSLKQRKSFFSLQNAHENTLELRERTSSDHFRLLSAIHFSASALFLWYKRLVDLFFSVSSSRREKNVRFHSPLSNHWKWINSNTFNGMAFSFCNCNWWFRRKSRKEKTEKSIFIDLLLVEYRYAMNKLPVSGSLIDQKHRNGMEKMKLFHSRLQKAVMRSTQTNLPTNNNYQLCSFIH